MNNLVNQLEVAIYDLKTENNHLRREIAALREEKHVLAFQLANFDPTGQDLDDWLKATHEPENYDHIKCPIQRAELKFGA